MFSNCTCETRNSIYRFSTRRLSFEDASTACKNERGRLARFLTTSDYEKLNSCCSQAGEYWIGLAYRGECPLNEPYRWENTRVCRNAAPLAVITQPNNGRCLGVTIRTGIQQVVPIAREIDCVQPRPFICRYLLPKTTTSATKTSISPNRTNDSTTAFSSFQLSSVTSSFPVSFHTSPTTMASSTQSETNAAIISSIILASIILILLLAIFSFWQSKKNELALMKRTSATSEQPGPSLEQLELTSTHGNQEQLRHK